MSTLKPRLGTNEVKKEIDGNRGPWNRSNVPRKEVMNAEPSSLLGAGSSPNSENVESSSSKKKKKRKTKAQKEERKRQQEERFYQLLYKPKDTHVTTIDPAVFEKLKAGNASKTSVAVPTEKPETGRLHQPDHLGQVSLPMTHESSRQMVNDDILISNSHFPLLGDSPKKIDKRKVTHQVQEEKQSTTIFRPPPAESEVLRCQTDPMPVLDSDFGNVGMPPFSGSLLPSKTSEYKINNYMPSPAPVNCGVETKRKEFVHSSAFSRFDFPNLVTSATDISTRTSAAYSKSYKTSKEKVNNLKTKNECHKQISVLRKEVDESPADATTQTTCASSTDAIAKSMTIDEANDNKEIVRKKVKSKNPLIINLEDLIVKPVVPEPKLRKQFKKTAKKQTNEKVTHGNILDSTGPKMMLRGKIRQKKQKKPSTLKKVIMQARLNRKMARDDKVQETATESSEQASERESEPKISSNWSECNKDEESQSENKTLTEKDSVLNSKSKSELVTFHSIFQALDEEIRKQNIPAEIFERAKKQLHKAKFKTYCDMFDSKDLFHHVSTMLNTLQRLQDILYHSGRLEGDHNRKYVHGLRAARVYLLTKHAKLIILAPNIESVPDKGGLNDLIQEIIRLAKENGVPYLFTGNRFILGKLIKVRASTVSCITVLNDEGAEQPFRDAISEMRKLREDYESELQKRISDLVLASTAT